MERSCVDGPASATHRGQIPNHALLRLTSFRVENLVCGACVRKIETRLEALPGVVHPRANLSMKTVSAEIDAACTPPSAVIHALEEIGFSAFELDPAAPDAGAPDPGTKEDTDFISQMAVAGFAAANIMLLSVSVWSDVSNEMSAATRATFHWVSAAIAVPTVAYAGQPFFRSALSALKAGRLNMDVPISLGVLLATAMSLAQAWQRSDQVYFDAAVTLLFFLLLGRFLDLRTRVQARSAAAQLLNLRPRSANVVDGDGRVRCLPERDFAPGMTLLVAHGERIGADGCITSDRGEIDESIITGESRPRTLTSGDQVFTGSINIGPALRVRITSVGEQTLLSELGRLMQAAEQRRGTYVRLADKAAAIYAPAVHLLALATVLGWLWLGNGWEAAMTAGIATLIITCPCALALAVPAVQVAASSRLFKQGIIVKSPDGLERLAEVDTIVFDKTGTLTTGVMRLSNHSDVRDDDLQLATSLAVNSRHPYCQALTAAARAKGI
ncbi:MAG: Cu2+-exporting ATPase, partial [Hyphomicrobiaceae bacterium]